MGQKNRSGRKPNFEYVDLAELVNKSIWTVNCFLNDPNIPLRDKADLAVRVVLKRIPDRVAVNVDIALDQNKRQTLLNEMRAAILAQSDAIEAQARVGERGNSALEDQKAAIPADIDRAAGPGAPATAPTDAP